MSGTSYVKGSNAVQNITKQFANVRVGSGGDITASALEGSIEQNVLNSGGNAVPYTDNNTIIYTAKLTDKT